MTKLTKEQQARLDAWIQRQIEIRGELLLKADVMGPYLCIGWPIEADTATGLLECGMGPMRVISLRWKGTKRSLKPRVELLFGFN